ncbi:MAG: DNA repair protein RecN [Burkholderiales bacterium]|nr:DNA repair protein RecN [Burkholderiales bacterium]
MLRHLSIRDFAIVESADLEFLPGFTALTGETGAGKSILVDALALALGGRADTLQVRDTAERAEVGAEFSLEDDPELQHWLEEQALEGDPERLLLRRVVERGGRTRAFVNGHPVTLAQLRQAGEQLVDIHGQHAHQSLLRPDARREVLDAYAGLADVALQSARAHREWQSIERDRAQFEAHSSARMREQEQVCEQVAELTRLAPAQGEWDRVAAEHSRLANALALREGAGAALAALAENEGAALAGISTALSRLRSISPYDAGLSEPVALLESGQAQLEEAARALRRYADGVELDPQRLTAVEARMEALHSAARRFRVEPEALGELLERSRARLQELEQAGDPGALAQRQAQALARYRECAQQLTRGRRKAAARLSREASTGLAELALKGARLEVSLVPGTPGGSPHGDEGVEFLFASSAAAQALPLARVASGGELSRVSLAIQVVTGRAARVPTLVFDEVDAGIGGAVAEVVGRRLHGLGAARQVLCVTHLAQVAAQADNQWRVSRAGGGSRVQVLRDTERVEEIARMLGGVQITETTRRHATEMLRLRAEHGRTAARPSTGLRSR